MRWLVVALVLVGCSDGGTGPGKEFRIDFSNSITHKGWNADTERWECHFVVLATASGGTAGESAAWLASSGEWVWPGGGRESFAYGNLEMAFIWGNHRIKVGETRDAIFTFDAATRFQIRFTFRHENPGGQTEASEVLVECD